MKEILAALTAELRRSPQVNQRSGVSVRYSIGNLETLVAAARAPRRRDRRARGRAADRRPSRGARRVARPGRVRRDRGGARGGDPARAPAGRPCWRCSGAGCPGSTSPRARAVRRRASRRDLGPHAGAGVPGAVRRPARTREAARPAGHRGGVARRGGVGAGVRAGGAAPVAAAEQGRRGPVGASDTRPTDRARRGLRRLRHRRAAGPMPSAVARSTSTSGSSSSAGGSS